MKKLLIALCLIFINVSNLALAASISPEEERFVHKISQTVESLKNHKNIVFNTYDLSKTPLVVTFPNGHIYAFGLKSQNPVWKIKTIANVSVLFTDVDQWEVRKVSMQDKFLMDGEEVFVFQITDKDNTRFPEKPLLILVHELFHRYQFDHFRGGDGVGEYVDQPNVENLTLISLEERILVDFLKVKQEYKLDVLKNYIAVNKVRSRMLNPSSLKWERFQQVMEGLADYASIQTFKAFPIIPDFDEKNYLSYVIGGYIHSQDHQELAVKWRHYGVGATLGFALDFLKVNDWKKQIEQNGDSQGAILERVVALSEDEIKKRVQFVKNHYNYKKLFEEIKAHHEAFNAMIDGYLKEHANQDGLVVIIDRPLDVAIYGGGRNLGIFHLEDEVTVSVSDTSYSCATDKSWKIEFKEIPFLFQNGYGARILKVDHNLMILVDGQSYTLTSLKKLNKPIAFKSLSWVSDTSNFEVVGREGTLSFENNSLRIILNQSRD